MDGKGQPDEDGHPASTRPLLDGYGVRAFDRASDEAAVCGLDTSLVSDVAYEAAWTGDMLGLRPVRLASPRQKRFSIHLVPEEWARGHVAVDARGAVCGVIAFAVADWNKRMSIWHFYVDRQVRGRGLGRLLLDRAIEDGRAEGAVTAWVETSNLNHPGILAYRRLGFEICGFDETLYRETPSEGEFPIYMARDLTAVTVPLAPCATAPG